MRLPAGVHIKEKSWVAKLAARKLNSRNVAIVFGNTIHLHGVSSAYFLSRDNWVKHELKHVEQYRRYGYWKFLFAYLAEWLRKGYYNNRFEVEARSAENTPD